MHNTTGPPDYPPREIRLKNRRRSTQSNDSAATNRPNGELSVRGNQGYTPFVRVFPAKVIADMMADRPPSNGGSSAGIPPHHGWPPCRKLANVIASGATRLTR
jgi:hypothetical protein